MHSPHYSFDKFDERFETSIEYIIKRLDTFLNGDINTTMFYCSKNEEEINKLFDFLLENGNTDNEIIVKDVKIPIIKINQLIFQQFKPKVIWDN